jgi:hypothetical protein
METQKGTWSACLVKLQTAGKTCPREGLWTNVHKALGEAVHILNPHLTSASLRRDMKLWCLMFALLRFGFA